MDALTQRDHVIWVVVALVLGLATVAGIATEAGPTAVVASSLVAATIYRRSRHRDLLRLAASAGAFVLMGVAAAAIPTANECGTPLVESVQHGFEPTPHVHGPCEQANDRRAIAADALLLGGLVTSVVAYRRRRVMR